MRSRFLVAGTDHAVWLSRGPDGGYSLHGEDVAAGVEVALAGRTLSVEGVLSPVTVAMSGDDLHVHLDGRTYVLRYLDPIRSLAGDAAGAGDDEARAPMPGTVVSTPVRAGDTVAAGDALIVIESMKLETTVRATRPGTVEAVHVREGQSFDRDQALVTLAPAKAA